MSKKIAKQYIKTANHIIINFFRRVLKLFDAKQNT